MAKKFNPKRVRGSWTGDVNGRAFAVRFEGYMDGTFLTCSYDEDGVLEHVGSDGLTTIVLNPNRKATLVLTLSQSAEANDDLSLLQPDPSRDLLPTGVLAFDDLGGSSVIKSETAWLRKIAEVVWGNEIQGREYTFGLADAEIHVGGSADA